MQFLTWKDECCTNPPKGWAIFQYGERSAWSWVAKGPSGRGFSGLGGDVDPKLACEAALWRNGVLPLEWYFPYDDSCPNLSIGSFLARTSDFGDGEVRWMVFRGFTTLAQGDSKTEDEAKRAAGIVLRALLADALDVEAARPAATGRELEIY